MPHAVAEIIEREILCVDLFIGRHRDGIMSDRLWFASLLQLALTWSYAPPAAAQGTCVPGTGGTIEGIVVDKTTRAPVPGAWVVVLSPLCRAVADGTGRFTIDGVPAGSRGIDAGHVGFRSYERMTATVAAATTTQIVVELQPGGPLEDCRAIQLCAPLLAESPGSIAGFEEQFRFAAYGTAIAIAWNVATREGRWYACVDNESASVVSELGRRYPAIVGGTECGLGGGESPGTRERLVVISNGAPAFRLHVRDVRDISATRRRADVGYMVAGRWAQGWDCDFERVSNGWRAVQCVHVWES